MKVLVDECVPREMKLFLASNGHDCLTVQEAGWAGKRNGELLQLAENAFNVFVTLDTNLQYQQNLAGHKIGLVVLLARSSRLADLSPHFPACAEALRRIKAGEIMVVGGHT